MMWDTLVLLLVETVGDGSGGTYETGDARVTFRFGERQGRLTGSLIWSYPSTMSPVIGAHSPRKLDGDGGPAIGSGENLGLLGVDVIDL